jgi:hypothetical protein
MAELSIKRPVQLQMEVLESEDNLGSFKTAVEVIVSYPSGCFKFEVNNLWFKYTDWDAFSQDLIIKSADPVTLTLRDMSEQFELTIELREGSQYAFGISCSKFQLERGTTHLDFATVIDQEVFSEIAVGFNNFPRWW